MHNQKLASIPVFWLAVIIPFVFTYLLYYFSPVFLNSLNQMQFPIFVPKFDPIGIDLRWIWQIEQNWIQSGFIYPRSGAEHFPPFILLLFIWCSKLNFQDAYTIFSFSTLFIYLITAIGIPYLLAKNSNKDISVWLISIPFALFGLSTYGFQFEVERGQWNLLAVCFAVWGFYFLWCNGRLSKSFAIGFLTLAIQLKIYPAIFIVAYFACRKSLKDGIATLLILATINFGLFFIFGWNSFINFINSVISISQGTSYGVAQSSISAFLWLISQNFVDYLPMFQVLILIYCVSIIIALYYLVNSNPTSQDNFISLIVLLIIIGIIVPAHGNDYKLSLMSLVLSIMSPQLITISNLRARYKLTIPLVFIMFFLAFSTSYSYATKPSNIFIQNNVLNLLVFSFLQCILIIFIFKREVSNTIKKIMLGLASFFIIILSFIFLLINNSSPIIKFNGPVSTDQMKNISLDVNQSKLSSLSITANVIATNNSSTNFNTVNTSGLPVRLSWRFVKVSLTGNRMAEGTWDARKDLFWTIQPGNSDQIELTSDLPKESGNYLFEVTIVQDLVSFFHDAGMNIVSIPVKVD
jgi:hypothetical protein